MKYDSTTLQDTISLTLMKSFFSLKESKVLSRLHLFIANDYLHVVMIVIDDLIVRRCEYHNVMFNLPLLYINDT